MRRSWWERSLRPPGSDPDRAATTFRVPDARVAAPRPPTRSTGGWSGESSPNTVTTTNSLVKTSECKSNLSHILSDSQPGL